MMKTGLRRRSRQASDQRLRALSAGQGEAADLHRPARILHVQADEAQFGVGGHPVSPRDHRQRAFPVGGKGVNELRGGRRPIDSVQKEHSTGEGRHRHGPAVAQQPGLRGVLILRATRPLGQGDGLQQLEVGQAPQLHDVADLLGVHVGAGRDDPVEFGQSLFVIE